MTHKVCLIIDENSVNGIVAAAVAKVLSFQIVNVDNEDDALSFITSGVAEVVILNYHMEKLDTSHLLKKIRENVQGKVVPVVITTGIENENLEHEVYELDADGFLNKPITMDSMATVFRKLSLI